MEIKLFGVTTTFNEEKMIPYVMPYLLRLGYDKLIVYDNHSTDNTVNLLKKYDFIDVREYGDNCFDENEKTLQKNFAVSELLNEIGDSVAWITTCDFDEVFYFDYEEETYNIGNKTSFKYFLERMTYLGYNVCTEELINIMSYNFPSYNDNELIHKSANLFTFNNQSDFSKPNLFKLNGLSEFMIMLGGHAVYLKYKNEKIFQFYGSRDLFAFHLKYIDLDYVCSRQKLYKDRGHDSYAQIDDKCKMKIIEKYKNSLSLSSYIEHRKLNQNSSLIDNIHKNVILSEELMDRMPGIFKNT